MKLYGAKDPGAFLRSLAKPFQTLALMRAGIDQEFAFSDLELAVISASHAGEAVHRSTVDQLLVRGGLEVSDLLCGTHPPLCREEYNRMLRAGETADARSNNCSGKHAGMLLHEVSIGGESGQYLDPSHPVQLRVKEVLSLFTGVDLDERTLGVDGCGLPTWQLSLEEIAQAYSRLGDDSFLASVGFQEDASRLQRSLAEFPREFSGAGRTPYRWSPHLSLDFLSKEGAEGTVAVWGPKGSLVVKVLDGRERGYRWVVPAILEELGWVTKERISAWRQEIPLVVENVAGKEVGRVSVELPKPVTISRQGA